VGVVLTGGSNSFTVIAIFHSVRSPDLVLVGFGAVGILLLGFNAEVQSGVFASVSPDALTVGRPIDRGNVRGMLVEMAVESVLAVLTDGVNIGCHIVGAYRQELLARRVLHNFTVELRIFQGLELLFEVV